MLSGVHITNKSTVDGYDRGEVLMTHQRRCPARHVVSRRREETRCQSHSNSNHRGEHQSTQQTDTQVNQTSLQASKRIRETDQPIITTTKALVTATPGTMSLAQGIVHWEPPADAIERAQSSIVNNKTVVNGYGPDEGNPELRARLKRKLEEENGLAGHDVHVTAGANQAFSNLAIALLDPEDRVVLFRPYYFNHMMAVQMTGGGSHVVLGPYEKESYHPDFEWLAQEVRGSCPPKMVVLVNPNNPSGALLNQHELDTAAALCEESNTWLVIDNTYEHFVYDGREHYCPSRKNVIHIFSFSKAFGMMGWRQGYIAFREDAPGNISNELLKVQDTVPICATQVSQQASLGALEAGREWVKNKVEGLSKNRDIVLKALECLGPDRIAPSEGAIYVWCKLPEGCERDDLITEWLVKKHKICVIPGTACGTPGHIRVAFANLDERDCEVAASRLASGLQELVHHGMDTVIRDLGHTV